MSEGFYFGIITLWVIVPIISLIVTYHLIKAAVKSANKRQTQFSEAQTRLLVEIAKKQGVEEDKIAKIQERLS